jgi:long-chain acyl-CoA synthetase
MGSRHTLVHQLADWAEQTPDAAAIHGKNDSGWYQLTWAEYWTAAREVAKGLIALGHTPGDCVAIVGNNRTDWTVTQFGIMAARGIPAPIYTTLTYDQVSWIVDHCKAKLAVCDGQVQYDKYRKGESEEMFGKIEKFVTFDKVDGDERTMTLDELRALGREQDDAELDKRLGELSETETALLIYTSGTTGQPKAVQLDQGGMVYMASVIMANFPSLQDSTYRSVSYLPLCHVAEQLFTNMLHINSGGEVYFCPDLKQIKDYLIHAKPTLFLGVPRVWEKFQAALEAKLGEQTGFKAWLTQWALRTELAAFKAEMATGKKQDGFLRGIANKLVISKVKGALGLDELLTAATGAAPIGVATLDFFASLGITVYEGYGMSETTGVATCPVEGKPRFGTVGPALDGVTIQIAEDGEILLKGRGMTRGYLHQAEKTAELLDDDGWLHTGDLGSVDGDGYLKITGRKKDIIITAGGKNIAPAEMEAYIKSITGVAQVVVVGDRQPYLSALVTLDPENLEALAKDAGIGAEDLATMAANEVVSKHLMAKVESECNEKVARYQTIKKIKILPIEFTVDGGEITPTMKIKRNVVNDMYKTDIAALYA